MLITRSNIKTLKPISTMDYDPSEEFSKSSVNGQHLFRNKEMKEKIKIYHQEKTEYSQCEYIDYDYMRYCMYTNNQEL